MSTPNTQSAADMSTDELAAGIRQQAVDNPAYTAGCRPAVERLAKIMRERLPHITTATTGELMIHLSCFLTDAVPLFEEEGLSAHRAAELATNVIALAGVELYGSQETQAPTDRITHDAASRIHAWRQQLDADTRAALARGGRPIPEPLYPTDEEVPCRYGCGTDLRASDGTELPLLLADLDAVLAALDDASTTDASVLAVLERADDGNEDSQQAERDADVRAVARAIEAAVEQQYVRPDLHEALAGLHHRFADRLTALEARDAAAGGCQPNGDPIWEEQ